MKQVVARCNGTEIVDRGDEVWIVMKDLPSPVWPLIAGLLACITLINGTLQAVYAGVKHVWQQGLLALVLLTFGAVFIKVGIALRRAATKAEEAPAQPVLILEGGHLLDAQRRELAPLEAVTLSYVLQLTSSSKALTLTWPTGSLVVARGNPFGDPVDDCAAALEARGMRGP